MRATPQHSWSRQNQISKPFGGENFDPIAVRIFDERQAFHVAIVGSLYILHAKLIKACAGGIHIRYRDADMTKTTRVIIAAVIDRPRFFSVP